MKVLVLGGGGREHALVWRLRAEGAQVWALPGNDAIEGSLAGRAESAADVLAACEREQVELVVVGPEAPLAAGVSDALRSKGLLVVGPSAAAAQLETSKIFAKVFMQEFGVATARHVAARGRVDALAAAATFDDGAAVKFEGLAGGKGVIVADDARGAVAAVVALCAAHGDDAAFVLEERLTGPEVSLIALTDGAAVAAFPLAQDHKRLQDGDQGPNTGGMGAYAPVGWVSAETAARIDADIVQPTLRGLAQRRLDYRGFLYFGVMLTPSGPRLLEYNVRLGDPEAEVLLPLAADGLVARLVECARGQLAPAPIAVRPGFAVDVVLAAQGYPAAPVAGAAILGLDRPTSALVFHAGTARADGVWRVKGGRVLNVVGQGATLEQALSAAYEAVGHLRFDGMQHRRDIAGKAR